MPTTVTIRDESVGARDVSQFMLQLPAEQITVEELIRSRVYQEVKDEVAKARSATTVRPLIARYRDDGELREAPDPGPMTLDWRAQFEVARDGFCQGAFLILVDDRQMEHLEQPITIEADTEIVFLRLTPLVGG